MGWLSWVIVGLIAGSLAKMILPGRDPGGFFITAGIGIVGGLIGGFIGAKLGLGSVNGINVPTILLATGGAILLLLVYRMMKR